MFGNVVEETDSSAFHPRAGVIHMSVTERGRKTNQTMMSSDDSGAAVHT